MSKETPQISELTTELSSITEWQDFAVHLPNIEMTHIRQIEAQYKTISRQKLALFENWLDLCPKASWEDVKNALHKVGQNAVAEKLPKPRSSIKPQPATPSAEQSLLNPINNSGDPNTAGKTADQSHLTILQVIPSSSEVSTPASTVLVVDSSSTVQLEKKSVKAIVSQFEATTPMTQISATAVSNKMPKTQELSTDDIPKNAEKDQVLTNTSTPLCAAKLENLQKRFSSLISVVKSSVQKPTILPSILETIEAMMPIKIPSKDQLFHAINPHYDILDYQVIIEIVQKFTNTEVISQLHEYNTIVKEYRESTPIQAFLEDLKIITESQLTLHLPKMIVELEKVWVNVPVNGLFLLVKNLLPTSYNHYQYSLLKHLS